MRERPDVSGLRGYAEELTAEFARLRRQLAEAQRELGAVRVTARSPDGLVSATVGFRGQLTALELDPRIYRRQDTRWLGDAILRTVQQAVTEAAQKVDEISERHGPKVDLPSIMDGQLESRLSRFDFVLDELTKGAQR